VLEGVLCQSLLPRANGPGRAMALEIMVPNAAIRNLVREDKIHQIYSAMQMGQEQSGMQTLNQSLSQLYQRRMISMEVAMSRSPDIDELRSLISQGPQSVRQAGQRAAGGRG
jgi:twitching motility protein PilT